MRLLKSLLICMLPTLLLSACASQPVAPIEHIVFGTLPPIAKMEKVEGRYLFTQFCSPKIDIRSPETIYAEAVLKGCNYPDEDEYGAASTIGWVNLRTKNSIYTYTTSTALCGKALSDKDDSRMSDTNLENYISSRALAAGDYNDCSYYGVVTFDPMRFQNAVQEALSTSDINDQYQLANKKFEAAFAAAQADAANQRAAAEKANQQATVAETSAKADEARRAAERLSSARQHWNALRYTRKSVGEKICTWDNKLGYVEKVAVTRIKIRQLGRDDSDADGFFFGNSDGGSFQYQKADTTLIWGVSTDWGHCDFSDPD